MINQVADYLSRIKGTCAYVPISVNFPHDFLDSVNIIDDRPWHVDLVNYLASTIFPPQASKAQICKLQSHVKYYN